MAAWIEIPVLASSPAKQSVAALVAAWIEIDRLRLSICPSVVAALVAAWIEIAGERQIVIRQVCRGPCGRVD